jgi:periplasmic protein TonB
VTTEAIPEIFARKLPPVNDRMLTTCFLAALFHGIVILGVSFSGQHENSDQDEAPGLEVILVSEQTPKLTDNARAKYLAQRSQRGSGNTDSRDHAAIPKSSALPVDRAGVESGAGTEFQDSGGDSGVNQTLSSVGPSTQVLYFASAKQPSHRSQMPELLENKPDLGLAANEDDEALRLRGESHGELWITADTRESGLAVYLDSWRRKVEHVGTLNFPNAARRQGLSGTPIVEVAIAAGGKLASATIRRSSGHAEIDQAALDILKLASPFDPFPKGLRAAHSQIRFAYEWQFIGGSSQGSSVLLNDTGQEQAAP